MTTTHLNIENGEAWAGIATIGEIKVEAKRAVFNWRMVFNFGFIVVTPV
jgi:hypothetical protein